MRIPKVASRYAKALVTLAVEQNVLDAVKKDADFVIATISASRDLRVLFASPVIKPDTKQKILNEIFASSVGELTMQFMMLLSRHRREQNTLEIFKRFIDLYRVEKNIVSASITTAVSMDEELKSEFKAMIQNITKKDVEMNESVDADIIGGYKVRVGDLELDATLSGKLKRLQTEFKDNPYVAEY